MHLLKQLFDLVFYHLLDCLLKGCPLLIFLAHLIFHRIFMFIQTLLFSF
jgi:hypothetical protein